MVAGAQEWDSATTSVIAGAYAEGPNDGVLFVGITKPVPDPAKEIYENIGKAGVTGYNRYSFGGSGTDMGCGPVEAGGDTYTACHYADAEHVIYLTRYATMAEPDLARLLIKFRDAALRD